MSHVKITCLYIFYNLLSLIGVNVKMNIIYNIILLHNTKTKTVLAVTDNEILLSHYKRNNVISKLF